MNLIEIVDTFVRKHPILGPLIITVIAIGIFASSINSYMLIMKIKKFRSKKGGNHDGAGHHRHRA